MIHYKDLALGGIANLKPYQPGKPIEELERELGISNTIKLASNENPLGASPKTIKIISENLNNLQLYPDGNGFILKQKLAKKLNVKIEQITLGNGSNDIIELVGRAFLTWRREAIFSQYSFAVYHLITQAINATSKIIPALPKTHPSMPYGHNLDKMMRGIIGCTSVMFLANPNNPTGTWFTQQALEKFLAYVPKRVIVVLDEAYFEYISEKDYPDGIKLIEKFPNLVITRTFSKIYGLAGLRIGYAISSPEVADVLNRIRQPFNVNSLALLGASEALDDQAHVKNSFKCNQKGIIQWNEACKQRKWSFISPMGNFITIDFKRPAQPIYEALLKEGIIVRPIANYGLPNHLRITIGTKKQNTRCIKALDKVLESL